MSLLRTSESSSSSNSPWDSQDDCCDQFTFEDISSAVEYFSAEESSDYSIEAFCGLYESPTYSNVELRVSEHDLNSSLLNTPFQDFNLPLESGKHQHCQDIVDHFSSVFSHLPAFQGQNTPLFGPSPMSTKSQTSPPVLDILLAFSCSQFEQQHGVQNEETSLYFHSRGLQGLIQLLDNIWEGNAEEILCTIMLLVYYEIASVPLLKLSDVILTVKQLVRPSDAKVVDDHLGAAIMILNSQFIPSTPATSLLKRVRLSTSRPYLSLIIADVLFLRCYRGPYTRPTSAIFTSANGPPILNCGRLQNSVFPSWDGRHSSWHLLKLLADNAPHGKTALI